MVDLYKESHSTVCVIELSRALHRRAFDASDKAVYTLGHGDTVTPCHRSCHHA
jgi:hypothetical protein